MSGNFTDCACGWGTNESSKQDSNEILNDETPSRSTSQHKDAVVGATRASTISSTNERGAHLSGGRRYVMNEPSKENLSMKNMPLPSGLSVEGSDTELETATDYSCGSVN